MNSKKGILYKTVLKKTAIDKTIIKKNQSLRKILESSFLRKKERITRRTIKNIIVEKIKEPVPEVAFAESP